MIDVQFAKLNISSTNSSTEKAIQSLTDDQLLEKLVALNHQRAAEEK